MRLARIGLALSVCLNVIFFRWSLVAAFVDLPVDAALRFPPVTSWSVFTGSFEVITAVLLATVSMRGNWNGAVFAVATRLLKFYFVMQLIVGVLALMVDGMGNPFAITDLCRFIALVSLLILIEADHEVAITRDRARTARRAAMRAHAAVNTISRR